MLVRQRQGGRLSTNTTRRMTPPTPPIIPPTPLTFPQDLRVPLGEEEQGEEEVLEDDEDDGDKVEEVMKK